jgi:hypothetical protein
MKNTNKLSSAATLSEHYYNLLSDKRKHTYKERGAGVADAERWERRLAMCLFYADLAFGETE